MKFDRHFPCEQLKPYIKHYVVSEVESENEYKVLPSSGLVIGFQYRGKLSTVSGEEVSQLTAAGITGISDSFKIFRNSVNTGTVLVYFTETGFTHFASHPANELFNLSISLSEIFGHHETSEVEEKISNATTDQQRIRIIEQFLLGQLKEIHKDKLVIEAVKLIYESQGAVRISDLNKKLSISQSPLEKRFRKVVGTTPKKFASIVRFNSVLASLDNGKTLTEICYENNFFDQAHFIKDFRQFTGLAPELFKRFI